MPDRDRAHDHLQGLPASDGRVCASARRRVPSRLPRSCGSVTARSTATRNCGCRYEPARGCSPRNGNGNTSAAPTDRTGTPAGPLGRGAPGSRSAAAGAACSTSRPRRALAAGALDAAQSALAAAGDWIPADEITPSTALVARTRARAGRDRAGPRRRGRRRARSVAVAGAGPPRMLGLPRHRRVRLRPGRRAHRQRRPARARVGRGPRPFLRRLAEKAGRHFIPFDPDADYHAFIEGRPRLEGVEAFLDSRGISLPEGRFDGEPDAESVRGLARQKGAALARVMRRRRVNPLQGARRYLEAAGRAGARPRHRLRQRPRAADAPGRRTDRAHRHAGGRAGDPARRPPLRPAPDVAEAACRRLGVEPEHVVAFTHTPAGVATALAAGLAVVGVGTDRPAEVLAGFGAEQVVPSLGSLLDPTLAAASSF